MRKELISVVIPVYNSEKHIGRTIDSVLNQTYKNIEIIVVDDGSIDDTGLIVKSYKEKVNYFYQENIGVAVARNKGIKNSNGTYIAFLDADDYVLPNMYAILFERIQSYNADFACCNFFHENEFGVRRKILNFSDTEIDLSNKNSLNSAFLITGNTCWNKLFKKTLIQDIEFPKIKRGQDAVFMTEVLLNTNRLIYTQEPLYIYFQNIFSVTKGKINKDTIENYIFINSEKTRLIKKYGHEKDLKRTLKKHFYSFFLIYTNKIRKTENKTQKIVLWERWLDVNRKVFLKNTSLKHIIFFSKNINWVYYNGMIITGKFINPVLSRLRNLKYYFSKKSSN